MRADAITTGVRTRTFTEAGLLWAVLVSSIIAQIGQQVDTWYHRHTPTQIESFLTWPHALLYAGWLAACASIALYAFESSRLGEPRQALLPRGYLLVVFGAALFGLGGAFDFVWHELFGFEVRLEVFTSPAHQLLWLSGLVGTLGILRVAIGRRGQIPARSAGLRAVDIPVLLTLGVLARGTLWPLLYGDPLLVDYPGNGAVVADLPGFAGMAWDNTAAHVAGLMGIHLHSVLMMLFVLVPLSRLQLPGGAIAAIMLWNGVLGVSPTDMWPYLPAVVGAALVGEAIWAWMRRGGLGGPTEPAGYWVLGFAIPATQSLLYFVLIAFVGGGIDWSTHLWTGATTMSGFYGLITSLLAVPPRFARLAEAGREG